MPANKMDRGKGKPSLSRRSFPWPERNDLILCEQFDYAQQIGTLRRLKIKNDVIVDDNPEIIPVSGHLSFSFMFNLDGNTYMLPEIL